MYRYLWKTLKLIFPKSDNAHVFCNESIKSIDHLFVPHSVPHSVNSHVALCVYKEPVVRALVAANKYENNRQAQQLLAYFLYQHLNVYSTPPIILPIPLPIRRKIKRGHNQVESITKSLPRKYQKQVYKNYLKRLHSPKPQTSLTRKDRLENQIGSFYCKPIKLPTPETPIIILDDVLTTGSTLDAAKGAVGQVVPKNTKIITLALAH